MSLGCLTVKRGLRGGCCCLTAGGRGILLHWTPHHFPCCCLPSPMPVLPMHIQMLSAKLMFMAQRHHCTLTKIGESSNGCQPGFLQAAGFPSVSDRWLLWGGGGGGGKGDTWENVKLFCILKLNSYLRSNIELLSSFNMC